MNVTIIVVGFNRLNSLKRVLKSLLGVNYLNDKVRLIISVDKSDDNDIYDYIENFEWFFGEKIVIIQKNKLGLRNHILKCGDLSQKYGNIVILEDDIYVSPLFYKYVKGALKYYEYDENIAGISLYNPEWNQYSNRGFNNLADDKDTYFIQCSQSWGEAWTKNQWKKFKEWYDENKDKKIKTDKLPNNIILWPETSWLKYHMKYILEKNLYFVYPKISLSTNFMDQGQHVKIESNSYQSSLLSFKDEEFRYSNFSESKIKYDIFFEYEFLYNYLDIDKKELTIDLYGCKKEIKRYWLTTKKENYKIIKKFGLNFRPQENNIIFKNVGNDIFLYDTSLKNKNKFNKKLNQKIYRYDNRTASEKTHLIYLMDDFFQKGKVKTVKLIKKILGRK